MITSNWKKWFLVIQILVISNLGYANTELEKCLEEDWGIDRPTIGCLLKKWEPILSDEKIVKDFVEKSKKMGIDFSVAKEIRSLPEEDAVLCAPKHHLVVFENPYVRILWGSTQAGEREPFHVHTWKSLMVVIVPTDYKMEYPNGSTDIWKGNVGVYELPANERYACTNIGDYPDAILRFEVKD